MISQKAEYFFNKGIEKLTSEDKLGALRDFNKAIEISPDYSSAYAYRGTTKYLLYDDQGASNDFKKAIDIDPNNANAYFQRACMNKCINQKNFHEIINDCDKAIDIDPNISMGNLTSAHSIRAYARLSLNDYAGCIADCNKAIMINPKDSMIYINRGNAKASLGDIKSALNDYEKALEIQPSNPFAEDQIIASQNYLEQEKRDIELKQKQLMEMNPDFYIELKDAFSYSNRGIGKLATMDYYGAITDFNKAIEKDNNYATAYYLRGSTKFKISNLEDAIIDFNKAIQINSFYYLSYKERGEVKLKLGDITGAEKDLNKAKEIENKNENAIDMNELTFDYKKLTDSFNK